MEKDSYMQTINDIEAQVNSYKTTSISIKDQIKDNEILLKQQDKQIQELGLNISKTHADIADHDRDISELNYQLENLDRQITNSDNILQHKMMTNPDKENPQLS